MKKTQLTSRGGEYEAPVIEFIDIKVEKGFAASLESDDDLPGLGYNDDYEDEEY